MGTRLYVGNLPFSTQVDELQNLFSEAGTVTSVDIVMDKFTGRSRGFAFVEMADQAGADNAVRIFHGKDVGGRNLVVNEARPREERPSGGGGYGGGGYGGGGERRRFDRHGGGGGERRGGGGFRRDRGDRGERRDYRHD